MMPVAKNFYTGEMQVANLLSSIVRHALTEHVEQQGFYGTSCSLEKNFYKGEVQVVNLPSSVVRHALTEHVEQQGIL